MNVAYLWNKALKKMRGAAVRDSDIHKTARIEAGSQVVDSQMGRYSFCGYDCQILHCAIGAFCSIAGGVVIGAAEHPMGWSSTSPVFYADPASVKKKFIKAARPADPVTVIGNDVWIGQNAMIKAGVTIGDGAVIGMGSVLTKDVGPYEIWAGNPARLIRKRFDDETVDALLMSRWWDMDEDALSKYSSYFDKPAALLRELGKRL